MDKISKALMKVIYLESTSVPGKHSCTLSSTDLLLKVPYKIQLLPENLEKYLNELAIQDYYESKYFDKDGTRYYEFSLLNKGKSYIKEIESEKRAIKFKIFLTVGGFILAQILAVIFGNKV